MILELRRAAAALDSRRAHPAPATTVSGCVWQARVVTSEGFGGGGYLEGRKTRIRLTRPVFATLAAQLPGVPVRCWRTPGSSGRVWRHPSPDPEAPHADSVVGAVTRAWPMPDGNGVEADLCLVDRGLHQELLAIEAGPSVSTSSARGLLWRDAAVSLVLKYRGVDGLAGAHGITTITAGAEAEFTIYAVDLVNVPAGCAGACLLRLHRRGGVAMALPADWATCDLYRNTVNNSATATKIQSGKKTVFHDQDVSYSQTYYYWLRVVDTSGNVSGFSPSSGNSVTIVQINTPDLTPGGVTTPIIATDAVTNKVSHVGTGGANTTSLVDVDISGETITLTVSASGSSVLVTWNASVPIFNFTGALAQVQVILKLDRGGTTLVTALLSSLLVDSGGHTAPVSLAYLDRGVSGSTTYKIRWHLTASSCQAVLANESVLAATELKK